LTAITGFASGAALRRWLFAGVAKLHFPGLALIAQISVQVAPVNKAKPGKKTAV
jgi:hypothetical protein